MKENKKVLWIGLAVLAVLLLIPGTVSAQSVMTAAEDLIISFEGFSSKPYWDVNRYSWGYGTAAPNATSTTTPAAARDELQRDVQRDYEYLFPMLTRDLNRNQWAALLSFAYNTGPGNADNLIENINAGNDAALEIQWKKYIYAGGIVRPVLVERRAVEWGVWVS